MNRPAGPGAVGGERSEPLSATDSHPLVAQPSLGWRGHCSVSLPAPTVKPMQFSDINRQFPARPITSRKMGPSRWSRRRRTTLTDPDTISRPGALIVVRPCGLPGPFVHQREDPPSGRYFNCQIHLRIGADDGKCPDFGGTLRPIAGVFHLGPREVSGRGQAKPGRKPEPGYQVAGGAGGRRA